MSEKDIVLTCIWRSDGFVVSDSKIRPSNDEAILVIDENTEKITIQIPQHFSLITKKIIERRVQAIAKSGFLVPKTQIRIGCRFDVEITKDEKIPDVLLQEGHKYSLDMPTPVIETPSEPKAEIVETEYVPTFLKQETQVMETPPPVRPEIEADISQEPLPPETIGVSEQLFDDAETIAGRFLVALSKTGDVYITPKDDHYSVEYSAGRVDFRVQNGEIEILLTKRIIADDQTLKQAMLAATRKTEL